MKGATLRTVMVLLYLVVSFWDVLGWLHVFLFLQTRVKNLRRHKSPLDIVYECLPLACRHIGALVDLNDVLTLSLALKALKAFTKHSTLSSTQIINIIRPTLNCLSSSHSSLQPLCEKILYYTLEFHHQAHEEYLKTLRSMCIASGESLQEDEWSKLSFYATRVLPTLK